MTSAMREFDWSYEIGMYAGTAAGVLVLVLVGRTHSRHQSATQKNLA